MLELLVVLVLLGLLSGLAINTYLGRVDTARLQKVAADFSTLATALSLYRLDTGMLPTTAQGLQALRERPALEPRPARYKPGGYLAAVPLDPWGREYLYQYPAEFAGTEYDLYTLGADGESGGGGEDGDIVR